MLVENQLVEVRWNNFTKRWYEDKGYKFTDIGDYFDVNIEDLMPNSSTKVLVACDYCNKEYLISYRDYNKNTKGGIQKTACSCCGRKKNLELQNYKKIYYEKFCTLCKRKGYIPISELSDYVNAHTKLKFLCPVHGAQEITYASLYQGCGCNLCGFKSMSQHNRKSTNDVKRIVECKNNNQLINPDEYINSYTSNLRVLCGSCGREFITSLSSIQNSDGACIECGREKTKLSQTLTPNEVEARINSVNGNVLLNKNDYRKNNLRNLQIKCGKCGEIFKTSLSNYITFNVTRCPSCTKRISKGEKIIMEVLEKYDINYIFQMKFDDCKDKKKLAFDFYLPDYNICCEFDGQLHYTPKYGEDSFKITKLHDAMKDWYCRWNNINLLRIPYWEGSRIEEILSDKLNIIPSVSIETKHHTIKYIPTKYRK